MPDPTPERVREWAAEGERSGHGYRESNIARLRNDRNALARQVIALREALEPFAHPDLCETLGGNVQGDYSPVYGRNKAILRIGDFRRARARLDALGGG